MKLIFSNLKKNIVKLRIENLDDLWYLSHIIELNDIQSKWLLAALQYTSNHFLENQSCDQIIDILKGELNES